MADREGAKDIAANVTTGIGQLVGCGFLFFALAMLAGLIISWFE
jgi:hypothetical protein